MRNYIYKISISLNIIFFIFLLALAFQCKENIIQKHIERREKAEIVLFGDSQIEDGKWSDLLDRNDIKISGFGGLTTSHLRWLISEHVIKYNPKICLLEGGINDIGVGIPLERIKTNYKCLIDTLIAYNIIPVVHSTFYQENDQESKVVIDSLNNFLKNHCKQKSIRFLDINSKLSTESGLRPEYSKDGTHITESAYIIWSNEIKEILKKIEKSDNRNLIK